MHLGRVRAAVEELRQKHPELCSRPSWEDVLVVLKREGIHLARRPLPKLWGVIVAYGAQWSIILSTTAPRARYVYIVLHELAHIVLHHEPAERWETVYTMADEVVGFDSREDDADLFAAMILSPEVWQ